MTQQFVERTPLSAKCWVTWPKTRPRFSKASCPRGDLSRGRVVWRLFKSIMYQHKFTRMGTGIYRPRWQDTEASFTYQSSEQHNLLIDTMQQCDILRYINFVEISCPFREDPSLDLQIMLSTCTVALMPRWLVLLTGTFIPLNLRKVLSKDSHHVEQNVTFQRDTSLYALYPTLFEYIKIGSACL